MSSVDRRRLFPNRWVKDRGKRKNGGWEEQRERVERRGNRGKEEISPWMVGERTRTRTGIKMPGEKDEKGKFSARKLSID